MALLSTEPANARTAPARENKGSKVDRASNPGIEFEALQEVPGRPSHRESGAKKPNQASSAETFKLTGLAKTCDNSRLRSSQRKRAKNKTQVEFMPTGFVKNIQPISVGV
jgi:hypothetical protein